MAALDRQEGEAVVELLVVEAGAVVEVVVVETTTVISGAVLHMGVDRPSAGGGVHISNPALCMPAKAVRLKRVETVTKGRSSSKADGPPVLLEECSILVSLNHSNFITCSSDHLSNVGHTGI